MALKEVSPGSVVPFHEIVTMEGTGNGNQERH